MTLKLVGIGALGMMLSPAAQHLKSGSPAKFIRIHDRGTQDDRHEFCRSRWLEHGAEIVYDFNALLGKSDFDGIVVCAGKNGDDLEIFRAMVPILRENKQHCPFILHLSTVSSNFVQSAQSFFSKIGIAYANHPLTGGPSGAEAASMLILASGDQSLFAKLEPMLNVIGRPKFFGERVNAGAEIKLIGQLMVFNGLNGICSAAALKSACCQEPLIGEQQADFFDFLNKGAGGTRQWEVALSRGIREDVWDQGFLLQHAAVDAIYAAQLCLDQGISYLAVIPMLSTAISFGYILHKYAPRQLATHALILEMIKESSADLDSFLRKNLDCSNLQISMQNAVQTLPEQVRQSVLLEVNENSFAA